AGEGELGSGLTGHDATLPKRGPGRQSRFRIGISLTRRAVFACLRLFAGQFVRRGTQDVECRTGDAPPWPRSESRMAVARHASPILAFTRFLNPNRPVPASH